MTALTDLETKVLGYLHKNKIKRADRVRLDRLTVKLGHDGPRSDLHRAMDALYNAGYIGPKGHVVSQGALAAKQMKERLHYTTSAGTSRLCGAPKGEWGTVTVAEVTCPDCKAKLAKPVTPQVAPPWPTGVVTQVTPTPVVVPAPLRTSVCLRCGHPCEERHPALWVHASNQPGGEAHDPDPEAERCTMPDMTKVIEALQAYDAVDWAGAFTAATTDADVAAVALREGTALDAARRAFYEATKDRNSLDHCMIVGRDFLHLCAANWLARPLSARGTLPGPGFKSWKPEVIADGRGQWAGNALRFATKEEAEADVRDLSMRWMLVRETRVVESTDEVNYQWDVERGLVPCVPFKKEG